MITQLDSQSWSPELTTGNAQFIEIGSVIYVVSQVRADNTFAVFKSLPTPPTPGPGYAFASTAVYQFPTVNGKPNSSFDPVLAYDGSRYIYIVGTQDNSSGKGTDVLLFVYDIEGEQASPPEPLGDPVTLVTASYVRDSYDVCALGENQFIVVAATSPSMIWQTPTVIEPVSISISGGVITVEAPNSYQIGQFVTFSGLQNAGFLNNVSATIETQASGSFTAVDPVAAEFYTIPTTYPYTLTVNNADTFLSNSGVTYTASSIPLTDVTATNVFSLSAVNVAVNGTTTYIGTFPATLPAGTATIAGFSNAGNNGVFSVESSTTTTLVVDNPSGTNEIDAGSVAILSPAQYVAINGVYSFHQNDAGSQVSTLYLFTPSDYTQIGYENGFVTWLPGQSLLGFEMNMVDTNSPPAPFVSVTVLDSSPFRVGDTFGAVSAYSPDGVDIEVYYESHPKQVTYTDQIFNLKLATFTASPPGWNLPAATLTTFPGRYADSRLTVIPQGANRTLLQQYYSQLVQQNSLVGNLLIGYYSTSPPSWNFSTVSGSTTSSYIQGTLSVSDTQGAFVSYLAEPVYGIRGFWSPEGGAYNINDRVSYNAADYIASASIVYPYRGMWTANSSYNAGDVVKVLVKVPMPTLPVTYTYTYTYFTANVSILISSVSPNLDTVNWSVTPTPDVDSRFSVAVTSWPLYTSSLNVTTLNLSNIPGAYNNLNFTWLRGSKNVLDDKSMWGVVGEQVGSIAGATYVSDFDVPPIVTLVPEGSATAYRGSSLLLDASRTTDGDQSDFLEFTWTYSQVNSAVSLTSLGSTAEFSVSRSIGSAPEEFIVGVVAVDYAGSPPLHPAMNITELGFEDGVVSVVTDSAVSLADGEQVFLYSIANATFLNDHQVTVTSAAGDGFSATVNDIPKTEFWIIPTVAPYTVTVYNASNFVLDSGVVYASGGQPVSYTQAGGTYTFNASNSGKRVLISYTYSFSHVNYSLASDTGSAIANAQFASVDLSIPFNPAPTITFPQNPVSALRNAAVTLTPIFTGTDDVDDSTTYTWQQLSGTSIPAGQILSGTALPYLQFETNGVLINGESLVWNLTVDDGVNAPVPQSVTVNVAAYPFDYPDTLHLSRSVWGGNISQRNMVQPWSTLDVSTIYTNLQSIKRTSVLDGSDRYLLISEGSVSVYGGVNPDTVLLRKLFPPVDVTLSPPASYPILDAVHTEYDWTFVLDAAGNLYRFLAAPFVNTDNPDTTINLSSLTRMTFNQVFTTFRYANTRVVILSGEDGCLLLQLRDSDLHVEGSLEIAVETEMLYGVDNVQFVRVSNVESLRTGKVLLGTIAQVVADITSITILNNSVTAEANNTFVSGNVVTFDDLGKATFLNGVTAMVISATSTQFIVSYEHDNYPATAETQGTATAGGVTYETLIDLSYGQIIGTWDASRLRNQFVSTGEILFEPNDTYAGSPKAPYLNPVTAASPITGTAALNISWVSDRPDLVQSYDLESSFDGVNWTTDLINSGYIESVTLPEPVDQILYFRIRAYSVDGISPYSNVQTFNTGEPAPPIPVIFGFAVSFGTGFGTS